MKVSNARCTQVTLNVEFHDILLANGKAIEDPNHREWRQSVTKDSFNVVFEESTSEETLQKFWEDSNFECHRDLLCPKQLFTN